MEQARAPTGHPEPGGLQPAGATEDGGLLWARSLNRPSPDLNDIRRHVSSLPCPLSLHLSCTVSFTLSHLSPLSTFTLPPAFRPPLLSLHFFSAATICLSPLSSLLPPPFSPMFGWGSWTRLVEEREALSHLPSNEQLLCVPPALTEPKWPTHFTLLGLDLSGLWVTGLMASLWNDTMMKKRTKEQKHRTEEMMKHAAFGEKSAILLFTVAQNWDSKTCGGAGFLRGLKIQACLMASSLSSTVCMSQYSFRGFSFSVFPTWIRDIWCQGISTTLVND